MSDMKKKMNKFKELYKDKYEALEEALDVISSKDSVDLSDYEKLTHEFNSLLRQTVKLVKRSDSIQRKLRETREVLREKNDRILSDLEKAAEYVRSLLPEKIDKEKISTDWKFEPSFRLGGDAFGYNKIDEENLAVYLLDVTGHGIGSALHSISALNVIKYQNLQNIDFKKPEEVLKGLNKGFQMSEHGEKFFTLWYGVFNRKSSVMKYSSAGHPPAMLAHDGNIKMLENDNFVIGGLPEFDFVSSEIEIPAGSNLFVYSDGVYEVNVSENEIWDIDNLKNYYKDKIEKNSFNLDDLYRYVLDLEGAESLEDDFSAMVINFK